MGSIYNGIRLSSNKEQATDTHSDLYESQNPDTEQMKPDEERVHYHVIPLLLNSSKCKLIYSDRRSVRADGGGGMGHRGQRLRRRTRPTA